jgi:histidinol-phosphate/aromatic aminotransferase/cobyric acid decarboxylase-like protein
VGNTPVIITNKMEASDEADQADHAALLKQIEKWRNDWASINTDSYLTHYASDFATGNFKLDSWSAQKRLVNSGKSWIKVGISDVSIFPYPNQPNLVVVNFEQDYASNNLENRMKKRQYWIKRDNRWQIIYEGAAT